MSMKRTRSTRSSTFLNDQTSGNDAEVPQMPMVPQASSTNLAPMKVARKGDVVNDTGISSMQPEPQPQVASSSSPPASRPRVQFQLGLVCSAPRYQPQFPRAQLEECYYCRRSFSKFDDRYMNGGLEAFCSPKCREKMNEIFIARGLRSPDSVPNENQDSK